MTLPTAADHSENWRTPRPITANDQYHFELVFEIAAVILSVIVGRALFPGDDSYWMNVYMTGIGVLITVLVLDRRAERRTRLQEERELKAQLVRDASSIVNDIANNAVHQMRKHGWLEGDDGLLVGADLINANLQGVDLVDGNLQWADLLGATLQEGDLMFVNLQGAYLRDANLEGADLRSANLEGADLRSANLQGANLMFATLQKADLSITGLQRANLTHANLANASLGQGKYAAQFDETTILPDGTYWTPDTDLTKFTKPHESSLSQGHADS